MTPLTSALVLLALAVAIVAAFAFWLKRYTDRHAGSDAGKTGVETTIGFNAVRCEAAHCGDTGGD